MADRSVVVSLVAKIADFERGMAAATASTKKFEAELDKLRITTPRKLDAVGDAAKGTAGDIGKMAAAAKVGGAAVNDLGGEAVIAAVKTDKLGDEAAEAGRDMLALAARIEVAKLALHGLSTEFAGNGDASLTPRIRQARRELSELERVAKFLTPGDGRSGAVGAIARTAGTAAGGALESLGALGSKLRGAMIPIAIGAVAALTPIIGSTIGIAIVGAAGAGGIIGGIVLASKDTRVRSAWSLVGDTLKKEFADASASFVNPLIEGSQKIDVAFRALKPTIDSVFAELAKAVDPLARGGAGFLKNLGPGLKDLAGVAGPMMQDLAKELPNIGNAVSNMFQSFRQGGPELRAFFSDFLGFLKGAMVGLGNFVEFSAHAYDALKIGGQTVMQFIDTYGRSVNVQEGMVRRQLDVMKEVPALQASVSASGGLLTKTEQDLADAAKLATDAIQKQNQAFRDLHNTQLGAVNANIAFEQSMDDLTQSVDDNGKSLNIHSQKGRDNQRAILNVVGALVQQRDAEFAATGSVDVANAHFQQQIGTLRNHLVQLGFSKGAVDRLVGSIRAIPPKADTKINVNGAAAALNAIKNVSYSVGNLDGRVANVTVRVSTVSASGGRSGGLQGMASGTDFAPGGLAVVGEEGPEIVNIPRGSRVFTHSQSVAMARMPAFAGGIGNSGPMSFNFNVSGASTPFERALAEALRSMTLSLGGGNVQTAFGRR